MTPAPLTAAQIAAALDELEATLKAANNCKSRPWRTDMTREELAVMVACERFLDGGQALLAAARERDRLREENARVTAERNDERPVRSPREARGGGRGGASVA